MAESQNTIKLFESRQIRTEWDAENEKWWFSILDIISILTDQPDYDKTRNYWKWLKNKLKEEGSELVSHTNQLKMPARDGKSRLTDVADTAQVLRLLQSIPSRKVEPFKMWLAQVGKDRIDETVDPELTIDRALETYLCKGYSREWINQRLQAIQVRKELTDEWNDRGVSESAEYAILTDEITWAWAGMSTRQYKNFKRLKKENLRDNMSTLELVLNMLAEATTTEISKARKPETFGESRQIAHEGGSVAGEARRDIEQRSGRPVITSKNAVNFVAVLGRVIEIDDKDKE